MRNLRDLKIDAATRAPINVPIWKQKRFIDSLRYVTS